MVLECRLVAVPEPEVTWYYRGEVVKSSDTVSVTTQSDMHMYSTMVSMSKVTKGQEGVYKVVAKNREGQATLDIILKVRIGYRCTALRCSLPNHSGPTYVTYSPEGLFYDQITNKV